jgi:hypothetical protein
MAGFSVLDLGSTADIANPACTGKRRQLDLFSTPYERPRKLNRRFINKFCAGFL